MFLRTVWVCIGKSNLVPVKLGWPFLLPSWSLNFLPAALFFDFLIISIYLPAKRDCKRSPPPYICRINNSHKKKDQTKKRHNADPPSLKIPSNHLCCICIRSPAAADPTPYHSAIPHTPRVDPSSNRNLGFLHILQSRSLWEWSITRKVDITLRNGQKETIATTAKLQQL